MFADRCAIGSLDRAGLSWQITAEKLAEPALADEADAGAVFLGVGEQASGGSPLSDLRLKQSPDRKQRASQLRLIQPMQEVTLILSLIHI